MAICDCPSAGHDMIFLDYRACGPQGEPAVCLLYTSTDPITEEELARRISMTSLSVTSGGSFTAWFDCDEMYTDHAVTVYGSLKKGLKAASIEG